MKDVHYLSGKYRGLDGEDLLRPLITREFPGRIAVLSSFGTESAVLLRMVAAVSVKTPILFIDSGKIFKETLQYRDELVERLGLLNVKRITPTVESLQESDPNGTLWQKGPLLQADSSRPCCKLRKVDPLRMVLDVGIYAALITGRKQYQGGSRLALTTIGTREGDGLVGVNPLATMTAEEVQAEFTTYNLPRHPLEEKGYLSVGCWTCTKATEADSSDRRSGRRELGPKRECGLHCD
jgi:phosphoadenosine phosphosulfate reductase